MVTTLTLATPDLVNYFPPMPREFFLRFSRVLSFGMYSRLFTLPHSSSFYRLTKQAPLPVLKQCPHAGLSSPAPALWSRRPRSLPTPPGVADVPRPLVSPGAGWPRTAEGSLRLGIEGTRAHTTERLCKIQVLVSLSKGLNNAADQRRHTALSTSPLSTSPPSQAIRRVPALQTRFNSLLVLMHREALLAVPVNFPPSFSIMAFTSSLFRESFPRVRIFMLDNGLSGKENSRQAVRSQAGRDTLSSPLLSIPEGKICESRGQTGQHVDSLSCPLALRGPGQGDDDAAP